MADIIQLLPESIANQIAAGEVVQRPASAVKELIENSLDAGATSITLIVKEGGKTLMQVIDNGSGMSETDARMSLERHATSKIRRAEDLFALHTMGFRGEALASIAAVSQMEMKTRLADRELGTRLVVEASEVKIQEPVACEKGTSISVKNLFFNVPARRNFLKSNAVEMKHVLDEFQRLALAFPSVEFILFQGDEKVYDLQPTKLSHRIINLFGRNFESQLIPCKEETEYVRITGYVGKPEFARKTRGEQFFFVNKRFIRSNYLHHAVMSAYEGLLPEQSFPFYVLFLELDPKHIDVNVHPTKTEIKFDDERTVYNMVRAAVRQALGVHHLAPSLDFAVDVNLISKLQSGGKPAQEVYIEERFQTTGKHHWKELFPDKAGPRDPEIISQPHQPVALTDEEKTQSKSLPVFQVADRFIVQPLAKGILVIDQQPAHERILFEKFQEAMRLRKGESQQVLFPQSVTLPPGDYVLVSEMMPELEALGFRLEPFGKNTLLVTGIPAGLKVTDGKALIEGTLEQFKNQSDLSLPVADRLARALARRSGVKSGDVLHTEEMQRITEQLMRCKTPQYSPTGQITMFHLEEEKIAAYFNRS